MQYLESAKTIFQAEWFQYGVYGLAALGVLALLYVLFLFIHYVYIVLFQPIRKMTLAIKENDDGDTIVMHQTDLRGTHFKSGDFIRLKMKTGLLYKKIEGQLRRGRGNTINEGEIKLSPAIMEKLFGEYHAPETADFSISQSTNLWNSPDTSVRIGTRVTVYVTILTTIVSILIEVWSANYLPCNS